MADPPVLALAPRAIDILGRPAVRVRRTGGDYVDGRFVEGAEERLDIRAAVQPVSPEDLEQLPEGQRSSAERAVWTRADLRTVETGQQADLIEVDGFTWKVLQVWPRPEAGFHKAVVGRLGGA